MGIILPGWLLALCFDHIAVNLEFNDSAILTATNFRALPLPSSAGVTEAHWHTCIVTWMLRIQTQIFKVVWCNRCFTDWAISPISLLNRIPKKKLPLSTGPPYAMDTKQETQGRCWAVSCQFIGGLILLVSSTNQLVCFFSSSLSSLSSLFLSSSLSCPLLIFFVSFWVVEDLISIC